MKNPMWGVTGAAYLRIMEPQYEDGVGLPRLMNIDGGKLPDALTISSKYFNLLMYIKFNL